MNEILIESRGLCKNFAALPALQNVTFTLPKGRIVGLLGPNGSGKTTLLKLMNGLLTPTAGTLTIGGHPIGVETKKIVSYLPDRNFLSPWMTVEQMCTYFADFFGDFDRARANEMLAQLQIDKTRKCKTLSKGTQEKVALILAMSRNAQLYLLDEPIAGVDPAARDSILRTIVGSYREDATILISTHLIADVEPVLSDVLFLQYGHIVLQDTVDAIREREKKSVDALFREVFRC